MFMTMKRLSIVLLSCVMLSSGAVWAQESPAHNEIREMRDGAIAAFVSRDKDKFLAYFSDETLFTAMNNEALGGREAAGEYWDRMLTGSSSLISDIQVEFEVDELTTLYLEERVGTAFGDMTTAIEMRGGLALSVPLRWTAALVKQPEGWKVAALHFSANMFENPLESTFQKYLWWMLAIVALVGLLLGWIIGRRRPSH